jgi:hypothetical protein
MMRVNVFDDMLTGPPVDYQRRSILRKVHIRPSILIERRRDPPAFFSVCLIPCLIVLLVSLAPTPAAPDARLFQITVIDKATGRGVPLVELETVNKVRYYTDSNGIIAIGDPELMGQKVYFFVSSPGYEYPGDSFNYHGIALDVAAGKSAVVKITRDNIAERLYRMTGAGIYRDSVMLGLPVPIKHPLLDADVMGQDTVEAAVYRGKIYWFFGDTDRPSYPLGQFATSGAVSDLPGSGGLAPPVGVNLKYWVDGTGFSRPMIPLLDPPGPVWVGGLFTMRDAGKERLFTHFVEVNHDGSFAKSGLAEFDDDKAIFSPLCNYPLNGDLHPDGQPFRVNSNGTDYLYFNSEDTSTFPLVRAISDLKHIEDAATYQAFTCLAPGQVFQGANTQLDRDHEGHLIWGWKRNTAPLGDDNLDKLVCLGKMSSQEIPYQLRDILTDQKVKAYGGTVCWNSYRKRWIMITTQSFGSPSFLGEVWFSEADTPTGPWTYARKVASHNHYTFYNPAQHPFFDQNNGRTIYFEGTYTNTYSDVKDLTPRYNYNQLMYRLQLDDPRLAIPEPVYIVKGADGSTHFAMRGEIAKSNDWKDILSVAFYALPPDSNVSGHCAIFESDSGTLSLQAVVKTDGPTFLAEPVSYAEAADSPAVATLYSITGPDGKAGYVVAKSANDLVGQSPVPICRVWKNPSTALCLDKGALPE